MGRRIAVMAVTGGIALAACGSPTPLVSLDGGPVPLVCETPRIEPMTPATTGTLAGTPLVAVRWIGTHCELTHDDGAAGLVLLVADLTGTGFGELTAFPGNDWSIDTTTHGSPTSSYVPSLPRDTDVTFGMSNRSGDAITITFRVGASTFTLETLRRS